MKIKQIGDSGLRHIDRLTLLGELEHERFKWYKIETNLFPIRDIRDVYCGITYYVDELIVINRDADKSVWIFNAILKIMGVTIRPTDDFEPEYEIIIAGNYCTVEYSFDQTYQ